MQLSLNIHGSLAKLYRAFYNTNELPNNLCTYFWKLVVAILFSLPCYPALIINHFSGPIVYDKNSKRYCEDGTRVSTALGALTNFLFLMFGVWFTQMLYGRAMVNYMAIWKVYLNGIIFSLLIATIIIGIIALVIYIIKIREDKNDVSYLDMSDEEWSQFWRKQKEAEIKRERRFYNLAWRAFLAWKEKNCPIISWENK